MNRTDRLVAMVMFLQGRRLVRAEELAAHFEISVRTVYRDVAALSEAGVPVTGEAGVGYSLVKGYHLPPVMFDPDEATALFMGGEMVKHFTDASLRGPMDSALLKLRAVLPQDRQDQVERLLRQTIMKGRPVHRPGGGQMAQQSLLPVQQALVHRRVLRMRYRGAGKSEETLRDTEPVGIVFSDGAWYLVAWCRLRCDFRRFRIDRIQQLEILTESFPARPDFSLRRYLKENTDCDMTIPARVWFAREAEERAARESYATLVKECERDGGSEFTLFTFSLGWLAGWILSFGEMAEAMDPPELRQLVCEEANKVAARYLAVLRS